MKNTIILMLYIITFKSNLIHGQNTDEKKINEIRKTYIDSVNLVAPYYFNTLIDQFQFKASGTNTKDGKTIGSSATIDDKGIKANYFLKFLRHENFYSQLTLGASGKEKFIDVFSNGNLNKVYSGGYSFNWFPKYNIAKFDTPELNKTHNLLKLADICFDENNSKKDIVAKIDSLILILNKCCEFIAPTKLHLKTAPDCNSCNLKLANRFSNLLMEIQNFSCQDFDDSDCKKLIDQVEKYRNEIINNYVNSKRLIGLEKIQLSAKWDQFQYYWFSGSLLLNQQSNLLLDTTSKATKYSKRIDEVYISSSLSLNILFQNRSKSRNIWLSPTLKIEEKSDFNESKMVTINRLKQLELTDEVLTTISKVNSVYEEKAEKITTFRIEIPLFIFYSKLGSGFDFMIGNQSKFNADKIEWNNEVYGRFGIFFPIAVDDKKVITIEPLIKLNKLNYKNIPFFKDQFSIGLNLSFSLPEFITK
jgi:hypothetical protein